MTTTIVRPLQQSLRSALGNSQGSVLLVSPFISLMRPEAIVHSVGSARRLRILTDMNFEHFVAGASNIQTILALAKAGAEVRAISDLHAKVYVFNDRAIVGSANFTNRGLNSDLELGVLLPEGPAFNEASNCALEWWNSAERWPLSRITKLSAAVAAIETLRTKRTLQVGKDVERLRLVYIPKNARECRLLFECIDLCDRPLSPREVADAAGEHIEVIRDMLDLSAYMGLLKKWGIAPWEGQHQTTFERTELGNTVATQVLARENRAVPRLQACLLNYGLPNPALNIWHYPEYLQCNVRPWVTLLRCLAMALEDDGAVGAAGWGQRELALIVLRVLHESDTDYEWAAHQLQLVAKMPQEELAQWRNRYVTRLGYKDEKQWSQRSAGINTRLVHWPFYLGLIKADSSDNSARTFYDRMEGQVHVKRVLGLTASGRRWLAKIDGSVYNGMVAEPEH